MEDRRNKEGERGSMIKNERHSHAAKMLSRARELYKVYQSNLETARYNLLISSCDPYEKHLVRDYKAEIEDCKYMINQLQREIREWKQEIYKAQTEYHKAFGRGYLMENWIKADKAPKEYPIGTKFKSVGEVRRNDRKGFAQSHCRKTYNDRRKTRHLVFEFVVWLM